MLLSAPAGNLATKLILENECGMVTAPGDTNAFIGAAESLLHNQLLRDRMGKNARLFAERHFQIKNIADDFEDIIDNAITASC